MTLQEIEQTKENGRRKVFRVRFPSIYGNKSPGFICRTLLCGEIFRVFAKAGYPEREIPRDKPHVRCRVENDLFPLCVLEVPDNFQLQRAHSSVVGTLVMEMLKKSGFIEGTDEQLNTLKYGLRYANSPEGRRDALILHFLPSIRPYDLEQMTYDECSMRVMQALLIAKSVAGRDLFDFLTPDANVLRAFDPKPEGAAPPVQPPATQTVQPQRQERAPAPAPAAAGNRTEQQKAELLRKLGMAPNISPQAIGLNPRADIERGATRMFVAGEKYDVDALKPQISRDASG